jgi:hypothetical protein
VTLVLLVLAGGLLLGWTVGGSLARLGRQPLTDGWLVAAAIGVQAAGALIGGRAYAVGLLLSALVVVAFLRRNRGLRGTGLITLGLAANGLVVLLNGAMPVSTHAAARAGADLGGIERDEDPRHELAGRDTLLPWLGDTVPVRLPWHPEVVSVGDVLVAAGVGQLVLVGMGAALPGAPASLARFTARIHPPDA